MIRRPRRSPLFPSTPLFRSAKDMYFSRVAAIEGGLPVGTPCLTVNRLCGSGLQAIVSAAQHILLGDTDVAIGAGAESMSRDRKSTRLNSSHLVISYAVFCLK